MEKEELLKRLIKHIFWNDYNIDEKLIIEKINNDDKNFKSLLISKILYSKYASNILKKLFNLDELKLLLPQNSNNKYISYKLKLIKAIFFDEIDDGLRKWV